MAHRARRPSSRSAAVHRDRPDPRPRMVGTPTSGSPRSTCRASTAPRSSTPFTPADRPWSRSTQRFASDRVALPVVVRCDSRRAGAHRCLTCLDGEAGGPQEDGALLGRGTGWMSPYQGEGYF